MELEGSHTKAKRFTLKGEKEKEKVQTKMSRPVQFNYIHVVRNWTAPIFLSFMRGEKNKKVGVSDA